MEIDKETAYVYVSQHYRGRGSRGNYGIICKGGCLLHFNLYLVRTVSSPSSLINTYFRVANCLTLKDADDDLRKLETRQKHQVTMRFRHLA